MFIGEYHYLIDDKNRLSLPVKFRKDFAKGAVITRGIDSCLTLYPASEWQKVAERLVSLPTSQSKPRSFARLMLAGAMDVKVDSQGRIIIPDYLKKYAGLKKKVVIAGLYNKLEIWDESKWEQDKKKIEASTPDIADTLGELGI